MKTYLVALCLLATGCSHFRAPATAGAGEAWERSLREWTAREGITCAPKPGGVFDGVVRVQCGQRELYCNDAYCEPTRMDNLRQAARELKPCDRIAQTAGPERPRIGEVVRLDVCGEPFLCRVNPLGTPACILANGSRSAAAQ
jgi:hypothetical protein